MHPADRLVEFWDECDLEKGPFCHPRDRDILFAGRHSAKISETEPKTPTEWLEASRSSTAQLCLLPLPYVGDLKRAKIILCMTNPGLSIVDFHAEQNVSGYRSALIRQIRQEKLDELEYPFIMLDPELCWSSAYQWWMRKLQRTIERMIDEGVAHTFADATALVAGKIAVLELFPYHSRNFNHGALIDKLPSVQAIRDFAHTSVDDGRQVVVVRSRDHWGLDDIRAPNLMSVEKRFAQSASLGPDQPAGCNILNACQ